MFAYPIAVRNVNTLDLQFSRNFIFLFKKKTFLMSNAKKRFWHHKFQQKLEESFSVIVTNNLQVSARTSVTNVCGGQ